MHDKESGDGKSNKVDKSINITKMSFASNTESAIPIELRKDLHYQSQRPTPFPCPLPKASSIQTNMAVNKMLA